MHLPVGTTLQYTFFRQLICGLLASFSLQRGWFIFIF